MVHLMAWNKVLKVSWLPPPKIGQRVEKSARVEGLRGRAEAEPTTWSTQTLNCLRKILLPQPQYVADRRF